MRYTDEMIAQQNSPRYDAARQILDDILNKRKPNKDILKALYGEDMAKDVLRSIQKFYSDKIWNIRTSTHFSE